MSTIKVLHVIARMNVGGTAKYVGDLVKNIPESALATGFVQGSEVEDEIVQDLPIIRIPHLGRSISPWKDLFSFFELRKIVVDYQPTIIHSHTFKAGLITRMLPRKYKKIHTFHGHLFEDNSFSRQAKFLITTIERFLAGRTDVLISVGDRVGEQIRKRGIGIGQAWLSIKPGVEPLHLVDQNEARKELGLPDGLIIGWMARVTSVKNPHLLLEIARKSPEIQFAMAGGGDLLEEIRAEAPSNIKILGWSDARKFWSAIDIAISTSDNEGMPIALIEAQLAGIPVIATDVGSTPEVIIHLVTGIICKRKTNDLVFACRKLNSDLHFRTTLAQAASKHALLRFSKSAMLREHEDLYRRTQQTISRK
jgi:glycosyltransferase involved in cell wall biosynthesis